jgi:hypothetical protein
VNAAMNLRLPQTAGKLPRGYATGGLSSGAQLHRVLKERDNIWSIGTSSRTLPLQHYCHLYLPDTWTNTAEHCRAL